jgi:hypothetical protein
MGVIDERGRLFGVVNVIDLLVVTAVVATLVAGAAFVLDDDPAPPEDRYLTVVLDERPAGAGVTLDGDGTATPDGTVELGRTRGQVTDTYLAPTDADGTVTVARIRVEVSAAAANRTTDRRLVTEEASYLVGQGIRFTAGSARYEGYVHSVGRSRSELPVRTLNATVETRLPRAVAGRIEPGDTHRIDGGAVARVTAVERRSTADNRTHIEATVAFRVLETNGELLYGDQRVRPGADVVVAPNGYEFTGTVTGVS